MTAIIILTVLALLLLIYIAGPIWAPFKGDREL